MVCTSLLLYLRMFYCMMGVWIYKSSDGGKESTTSFRGVFEKSPIWPWNNDKIYIELIRSSDYIYLQVVLHY